MAQQELPPNMSKRPTMSSTMGNLGPEVSLSSAPRKVGRLERIDSTTKNYPYSLKNLFLVLPKTTSTTFNFDIISYFDLSLLSSTLLTKENLGKNLLTKENLGKNF